MNNRRQFIKNTSLAAAGSVLLPYYSCKKSNKKSVTEKKQIGLQLYTVRELMARNPTGTLANIAKLGYDRIETADYKDGKFYSMSPSVFKKLAEDQGLKIISSHVSSKALAKNAEQAINACLESGQTYLVLPWLDGEQRKTIDQYHGHIELMNKVGDLCNQSGLTFCYHNHDFEFMELEGQIPMDLILNNTDADKVRIELDLYWISKVGRDPIQFFEKNPGRCPLWHVKDMDASSQANIIDVGAGVIDFKTIFATAETSGLKHFFVEHDHPVDAIQSIKNSLEYIQKLKA